MAHEVGPRGQVIATDIDLRYLKRLRAKNLEVRQQDILQQMPEAGKYDLVTCRAVLHHIASPEEAIRNMVYALKPGGYLLLIRTGLPARYSHAISTPLVLERVA